MSCSCGPRYACLSDGWCYAHKYRAIYMTQANKWFWKHPNGKITPAVGSGLDPITYEKLIESRFGKRGKT